MSALILLSTYQGEKYLAAQLDSLIAQTYSDWILLIRDDGSTDQTISIIHDYCQRDQRISLVSDSLGNLNTQHSFSQLMKHALQRDEPYLFFCDQDDIWLPEKLDLQVNALRNAAVKNGENIPVLTHTDLCVVDNQLNTIHPSYLAFEKIKRNIESPLNTLLINNFVTGCTLGMNRALLNIVCPIPKEAIMHDWWCALCAAAFGEIIFIDKATIQYRQHVNNSIGSQGFYSKFFDLFSFVKWKRKLLNFKLCFSQAKKLFNLVEKTNPHYQLIQKFSSLPYRNFFSRLLKGYQCRLQASNRARKIIFWMLLIAST